MTMYTIKPYGRTPDMMGFTLVTLEPGGEERPLIVFPTEQQAKEAVAVLQKEDIKRISDRVSRK